MSQIWACYQNTSIKISYILWFSILFGMNECWRNNLDKICHDACQNAFVQQKKLKKQVVLE